MAKQFNLAQGPKAEHGMFERGDALDGDFSGRRQVDGRDTSFRGACVSEGELGERSIGVELEIMAMSVVSRTCEVRTEGEGGRSLNVVDDARVD